MLNDVECGFIIGMVTIVGARWCLCGSQLPLHLVLGQKSSRASLQDGEGGVKSGR